MRSFPLPLDKFKLFVYNKNAIQKNRAETEVSIKAHPYPPANFINDRYTEGVMFPHGARHLFLFSKESI